MRRQIRRGRREWQTTRRHLPTWRELPALAKAAIVFAAVWSVGWKGVSLWRAVRNESPGWFVALLVTNTLGVLDAIYLFAVDADIRARKEIEQWTLLETDEPEQLGHTTET
ncbi:hypothetical protein DVJ78_12155 [Humibacter sp. BT305]|nr:hypothetical protein DVJ78_12155 [Humibacter sp. BT305]